MFNFFNKLKFYVIKSENGNLACCSKSGAPLIGNNKDQLKILLDRMKEKDNRYKNCKIVRMSE